MLACDVLCDTDYRESNNIMHTQAPHVCGRQHDPHATPLYLSALLAAVMLGGSVCASMVLQISLKSKQGRGGAEGGLRHAHCQPDDALQTDIEPAMHLSDLL